MDNHIKGDVMDNEISAYRHDCFLKNSEYSPLFYVVNHYELLLINYKILHVVDNYELISQYMHKNSHQGLVIFNVPKDGDFTKIKKWPNLKGLFYEDTEELFFQKGFKAIKHGELWFPRAVSDVWMRQMLEDEQKTTLRTHDLTQKEIKVLDLLFTGLQSSEIAENLFISETTVRVHLHKIYQKISVKNKKQALLWCQDNLKELSS
jgi:DNA-binding NarL/FixJ family response regulator|tara:strand:+ start:685 stop:1302 length:618 start_codon:yes stop_codon:yes gene_type:complete